MHARFRLRYCLCAALLSLLSATPDALAAPQAGEGPRVLRESKRDRSPRLRDLKPIPPKRGPTIREMPEPQETGVEAQHLDSPDPVMQSSFAAGVTPQSFVSGA